MRLLIGLLAGFFGGITGAGGGIVAIPLLVSFLKLDQHAAHGISLVALVFTGFIGAVTYGVNGSVDLFAAVLMACAAVVTARMGAHFAHSLPEWKLKRAFGAFLLFVTALLLAKPWLVGPPDPAGGLPKALLLLGTGGFTGFLSGMMGVGGGSLMVPAMVLLSA